MEDEGDIYESIEDIWPDYPSKDDFFFNEDEYWRVMILNYIKGRRTIGSSPYFFAAVLPQKADLPALLF